MNFQGIGDPPVGPVKTPLRRIGLEQDAGMCQLASGGLACGDEVVEELSFFVAERDLVFFHDRFLEGKSPIRIDPSSTCKLRLADH